MSLRTIAENVFQQQEIDNEMRYDRKLPKHLAIILDGNRRWADKHGIPRKEAIWYGIAKVEEILLDWSERFEKEFACKPFEQLTIYALTLNNVNRRPQEELEEIYKAFVQEIVKMKGNRRLHERKVKVVFGGRRNVLPEYLRAEMRDLEELTEDYGEYTFFIPLAYDGNEEIIQAVDRVAHHKIAYTNEELEETFRKFLYFSEAKPIDMMIRTGGEMRLSGFMLWYMGYAELFFTKTFPEDFTYEEFVEMLEEFSRRERRFGK